MPRSACFFAPALACVLALCALACRPEQAPAPPPTPDPACSSAFSEDGVVAVLEGQRQAWNRGELDGFLAAYEPSEDLLFTSGAQIRRGFEETRRKYRARYGQAPETMGELGFEILDVRALGRCRDGAIVLGRWVVTGGDAPGSGVFSVILERREDRWLIVHDHTSSDPPAAPEAGDEDGAITPEGSAGASE